MGPKTENGWKPWVVLMWCWEMDASRWLVPYYEVPIRLRELAK